MRQAKELFVTAVQTANTVQAKIRDGELDEMVQFVPPKTLFIIPVPLLLSFVLSIVLNRYIVDFTAGPVLSALPYILLLIAVIFGGLYRQSRVSFIALFLIATTSLVRTELISGSATAQGYASVFVALLYLSIVIPSFFHANEQGLFNAHGLARLLITLSFMPCVAFLPRIRGFADQLSNSSLLIFRPLSDALFIPVLDILLVGIAILVMLVRNPRESPWLGPILSCVLIFSMVALNPYGAFWGTMDPAATFNIMMSVAAATLLGAIVECLRHTAHVDELTELPSRRSMNHFLSGLGAHYAIAMVDVDHFKRVNDTYGHDTGDQVLRFVASMLAKHAPGKCFRYGGEEFAIIGAHADIKRFSEDLDRMRIRIHEQPFSVRGGDRPKKSSGDEPTKRGKRGNAHTTRVSISIGVAEPAEEGDSVQSVIDRADKALYKAKGSGRNCLRVAR